MITKNDSGQLDCHARALPDEPTFTLLARDPSAPALILNWAMVRAHAIKQRERPESDWEIVEGAQRRAFEMMRWREKNDGKWRASV